MLQRNDLEAQIAQKSKMVTALTHEMERVIVGQKKMLNRLLIGLFTNGHILLEGVPGLAKSLTVSTLSKALKLSFKRMQFTPDLLPADLLGTLIYNQQQSRFEVKKGPVFANIILADEINRSPAKVQSALLEAMQEKQVTIGDATFPLEKPFLVLATQNPIDQEGTYPLPEAQVDRFMMKINVTYPTKSEEKEVMRRMAKTSGMSEVKEVLHAKDILEIRELIDNIQVSEKIEDYIVDIVMATRQPEAYGLAVLQEYIEYGVSPRASLALNLGAKAQAFLNGRAYVLPEDVKSIAPDVLNHRLILSYEAEADEISTYKCIEEILNSVKI